MNSPDFIATAALAFFVGMIWLRTRLQYRRNGPLRLTPTGRFYLGAAALALVLGWLAAPRLARLAWPAAATTTLLPLLARMSWYLATYYAFILIHRSLWSRGRPVFARRADVS